MLGLLFLVIAIPAVLVVVGVAAFILLPVKTGIAVAAIAFLLAAGALSWAMSIDLSH